MASIIGPMIIGLDRILAGYKRIGILTIYPRLSSWCLVPP